jgi:hypothetical protein
MNSPVYSRTLNFPIHPLFLPTTSPSTLFHNHILTYPLSHLFNRTYRGSLAHPLTRISMLCPSGSYCVLFDDGESHSDYVASVVIMMRIYTQGRIAEEAVLHNRVTASGFSAGLRKTTTNLSRDSGRPGRDSERVQVYSVTPTPTY